MVQRIVLGKLGIQADHVKSDKCLANLKPSFSQHQDGKTRETDKMKKMLKSRSFQLSDFKPSHSSSSIRSLSQQRKPPPLQVPIAGASPQQQKALVRRSPHYMKSTSSSEAKKEILSVSHRNNQSSSDGKILPQKCIRNLKTSFVSCKEPAKALSRSCSLNSMRTLTKNPSFKSCKACSKKFTSAALFKDVNAPERATCSSTLKDYNFPEYLMLHPEGTESEGVSVMKVCPYTYCSLNGHGHAPLPPLKSFISARRNMKLEAVIPQRWKVPPCDTKQDSGVEEIVFHGKPECDEADTSNPTITPLAQEIGMDLFFEIHAKEREGTDEMRKFNSGKDLKEHDINFPKDENGYATEEDGVKQVSPGMTHDLPKAQINFEEDFKTYFTAAAVEANSKGSLHLGQAVEDVEENHPPSWFHEKTCTGSYCNEAKYDGEHMEDIELDESNSQCREEEHFREFSYEDDTDSSTCSMEKINSKLKALSESSHDISEMWLDDIFSSHYADILVEEVKLQEAQEERSICFEAQPHCTNFVLEDSSENMKIVIQEKNYPFKGINCEYDQPTLTEEVFQNLTNAKDNNRENEKHLDYEDGCVSMVLDEDTLENSQGHRTSESCKIDDSCEDKDATSLENDDHEFNQEHLIHMSKVPEKSNIIDQEQKLLEENKVQGSKLKSTGGEKQHTSKNWYWGTKRKRPVEEDEEMRKINPRKPNFLPFVSEQEPEKVYLKHQMIDERKNEEEWMLDFALRQAVTRLAPARKRKVSLLIEAFETVASMPKCEAHMRNDAPFAHARPIQACS
ncbi:unnamed protein product [Sphenostylis stenocarpa]|uniref:Calmodulin-binding domain-containing protein n=1 Tax=Sphenostylis stenocarpa TaxID=92480 RepID=A0AA86S3X5_9FABA|nr:unnamed protein product [Sphenostylis stenocarpa]